jgi:hypothetical protein
MRLVTVEHDQQWAFNGNDARQEIVLIPEPIEPFLEATELNFFDLIFVDNSASGDRRRDTLRHLAASVGRSMVVAHDYDVPSYREACAGLEEVLIDDRQTPWTALLRRGN